MSQQRDRMLVVSQRGFEQIGKEIFFSRSFGMIIKGWAGHRAEMTVLQKRFNVPTNATGLVKAIYVA